MVDKLPAGKRLNVPFKSDVKHKKYSVYVKDGDRIKKINFGQVGYKDFRSGTASAQDRKAYLARATKIKNKKGELTHKDKTTANYWAVKYLWKG